MPARDLPPWAPPAGTTVAERYHVTRVLGVGGMGCVCEAQHLALGESVAIKFLNPAQRELDSIARFFREAKAAAKLKSEHVVRVLDAGNADGIGPYLVMERLEGEDLASLIAREGARPVASAVSFILQACAALAEAHAAEIVHRDVKPSNLFASQTRTGQTVVKVLGFGISKMNAPADGLPVNVTTTGATIGSPAYMAPEQVRSTKNADHRADVWSLGVVLYELLTGALPFDHDSVPAVIAAVVADAPTPLRERRPDVPAALEAVVMKCLEKDRAARWQSMGELAAALAPFARAADLPLVDLAGATTPSLPSLATSVASRDSHSSTRRAFEATERASVVSAGGAPKSSRGKRVVLGIAGALAVAAAVAATMRFARSHARSEAAPPPATSPSPPPVEPAFAAPPPLVEPPSPPPTFAPEASASSPRARAHARPAVSAKAAPAVVPDPPVAQPPPPAEPQPTSTSDVTRSRY